MEQHSAMRNVGCPCCGIPGLRQANPRIPDELPAGQSVCQSCSKHQGGEIRDCERRNRSHIMLWHTHLDDEVAKAVKNYEQRIEYLIALLQEKDDELEQHPIQIVYENLDQEVVEQALSDKDFAWQQRDRAFGSLSQIKVWHRDKGDGNCWCGISLAKCKIRDLLARDQVLIKWERKQLDRVKRGESNSFPFGHLALTDPRWVPEN